MRKLYLLIICPVFLLLGNGVSAQCSVTISTNPNSTQLNCAYTTITLKANAGGTGPKTYLWSNGATASSVNISAAGIYSVTITDSAGCTASSSVSITKDTTAPNVTALAFPDTVCSGASASLVGFGAVSYVWQPGLLTGTVVSVSPASTSTYTVTGTAANGCSKTGTIQLVVNPLPTASISGTTTACQNAAQPLITFTGVTGIKPFTFAYTVDGGPVQTITTIGTKATASVSAPTETPDTIKYRLISVTDGNGCLLAQDGTATVTVLNGPLLISAKATSICDNTRFTYTAKSSAKSTIFSWSRAFVSGIRNAAAMGTSDTITETLDNTTSQPVVAKYIFTLSIGSGCFTTDSVEVTVNPTPAIDSIINKSYCNGEFAGGGIPFTSSSPDISFTWTNSNAAIGLPASGSGNIPAFIAHNPGGAAITATVTVSIKTGADGCPGAGRNFTITVLPAPVLTGTKDKSVCNNSLFMYTAKSSAAGTKFSWTRDSIPGISNERASDTIAAINETLHNITDHPLVVKYIFSLSTGNSCVTTDSVNLTVNPTPATNSITNKSYCNGEFASGGIPFTSSSPDISFTWTNSNAAIGLPASGSGNIPAFIAHNPGGAAITATVTVSIKTSADGCPGADTNFTITVLPAPVLTGTKDKSVCNNSLFMYTATSSAAGTKFSWTRNSIPGISNDRAGDTIAAINETLHNNTDRPLVVKYIFSLSTGNSCVTTDSVNLTVNPTPATNSITNKSYCNGEFASGGIPFTSSSPDISFTWTNNNTAIGLPASGSGNIPAFIAHNPGGAAITATVTVSIKTSADGCPGADTNFTITVLPAPVLTGTKDKSVCNNSLFMYTATSSAAGTKFSWTRDSIPGISNKGASDTIAAINETLHNITDRPLVVKYIFSLSTGTACITTDSVKVTVNPTPKIDSSTIHPYVVCNNSKVGSIALRSLTNGALVTWTCSPSVGFGTAGSGSITGFTANNQSDTVVRAKVKVIASIDVNCPVNSATFVITVNPTPVVTSSKDISVCNNLPVTYTATSSAAITKFTWIRDSVAGINNDTASNAGPTVNDTLHNITDTPVVVKYLFTLSTGNGCTTRDSVKVTVNPTPVIDSVSNRIFCNGSAVGGINFTSSSPDASFTWICDTTIGFGSSGTGKIPAFVATNTGSNPVIATVTVFIKASSDSCAGTSTTFTITVLPGPSLTSIKDTSVCDNVLFKYPAASSAAGTVFSWYRPVVAGISNDSASKTGTNIQETIHNITDTPVVVKYLFSLSIGTGCITSDSVKVTVNPTPVINPVANYTFCNGNKVSGISFKSASPQPFFKWKSDTTVGFGSSGSDNIPSFIATNTGSKPVVANVTVSITASADQCPGISKTFTITVNPGPPTPNFTSLFNFPDDVTLQLCSGASNINFDVNSPAPGVSYTWSSTADPSTLSIRDTNDASTVISFMKPGNNAVSVTATNAIGGCAEVVSQAVHVENRTTGIDKRKIFLLQPGNLLVYPDNSLTSYQWGYDTVVHISPDSSFSQPTPLQGQVYQFFTPGTKFIDNSNSLDESKYLYWVLLQNRDCYTRVYYNGPYANRVAPSAPSDNTIQLQVRPDPNYGIFEVALKGNIYGRMAAKIYNSTGQVVLRKDFVKTLPAINETFNTKNLPAGLYFLVINSEDLKKITSRFVIQH